ncbi:putative receptor like protein 25 [Lycium barbarum]|uniref:putative receptor like protein 25 n=1 Tax=Lycium barbarum TaxID=112863 RepID=UPI00293E41D2|nr:putative receptor like protein 25 [Lycium barbarum]
MEIENILEVFTAIDFTCNNFQGEIPEILGDLNTFYLLNLSHNALTGRIPKALGKIPRGNQLQMLLDNSFEGNTGLCDFPLKKYSNTKATGLSQFPSGHSEPETIDGKYISFALGSSEWKPKEVKEKSACDKHMKES